MDKVLILPHVGTSYGHIYRIIDFIGLSYSNKDNITLVLPKHAIKRFRNFIPKHVKVYQRQVNGSICSKNGILNIKNFIDVMEENNRIFNSIKPTQIIGDPGIQASILSQKYQVSWRGIMHGCYLPIPKISTISNNVKSLMDLTWEKIHNYLDKLVEIGTNGVFSSWVDILKTGEILIPQSYYKFNNIGTHIELHKNNNGWKIGEPVELLITCCSNGQVYPSYDFIKRLTKYKDKVTLAGVKKNYFKTRKLNILGNKYLYNTLVDRNTTVLTHCGCGTLNLIKEAKNVKMIPGDLDQLCNALIAHSVLGWEIIFDKNWIKILNGNKPFIRKVYWENINIKFENDDVLLKGIDIFSNLDQEK